MRAAFDAGFAAPPAAAARAIERLVVVVAGGDRLALRLRELSGLRRLGRLSPLPGAASELLGLTGIRGRLTPVFSLARLLGLGADEPRWLALPRADQPLGLAFGAFEGYVEVAAGEIEPGSAGAAGASSRGQVVRLRGEHVSILDVASIVSGIERRAARATVKER